MNDESKVFGLSIRALIALMLTFVVCYMSLVALDIKEPMYTAFTFVLGFFFGQKTVSPQPIGGPDAKVNSTSTVTTSVVSPGPDAGKSDGAK